jgi:membrane dipeptidase
VLTQEALDIHKSSIIVDQTCFYWRGMSNWAESSGVTMVNATVGGYQAKSFADYIANMEMHHRIIESDSERLRLITHAEDIQDAKDTGRIGVGFHFQGITQVEDELSRIQTLYRLGARTFQLTYNHRNLYGDGSCEPTDGGLSRLGKQVVAEINKVGGIVDVAHAGQRTALDAVEASDAAVIISHGNPRATTLGNPRNFDDDVLRAIAESGGVVGACGWAPICWAGGDSIPDVPDLVTHIDYLVELIGIDHVALGLDGVSDDAEGIAQRLAETYNPAYPEVCGKFSQQFATEFNDPGNYVDLAFAVPLWKLPRTTQALLDRGYSAGDVRKILGENTQRVFSQICG